MSDSSVEYRDLDPEKIVETIDRLGRRIEERFPGSGLAKVCGQLLVVAQQAHQKSQWIARPIYWLRISILLLIAMIGLALLLTIISIPMRFTGLAMTDFVQVVEAGINDVVLICAGAFFLVSLETRIKRRRALAAIHELRSIAHIIDMHQLTKDPERVRNSKLFTGSSPRSTMSRFELSRYLDYCSEMLSLTGKLAALYVQWFDDGVALSSASEVETLTTGLTRKIWQKIMILQIRPDD